MSRSWRWSIVVFVLGAFCACAGNNTAAVDAGTDVGVDPDIRHDAGSDADVGADAQFDTSAPDEAGTDAAPFDPTSASCADLSRRFDEIVAGLTSPCITAADCTILGGARTCECAPSLGVNGSGAAVSIVAYEDPTTTSMLGAIASEFEARCRRSSCDPFVNPCVCDSAPPLLQCARGRCVANSGSCF